MVSTKLRFFSPVASARSSLTEPRTLATESFELDKITWMKRMLLRVIQKLTSCFCYVLEEGGGGLFVIGERCVERGPGPWTQCQQLYSFSLIGFDSIQYLCLTAIKAPPQQRLCFLSLPKAEGNCCFHGLKQKTKTLRTEQHTDHKTSFADIYR